MADDVTNDLSFMCIHCIQACISCRMPSLSIRVWNGSPHELLIKGSGADKNRYRTAGLL